MPDLGLLTLSIGIGLIVALVLGEVFGTCAGGLVVPGYLALFLVRPVDIALTLAVAWVTYSLVRVLASVMIVYGRRRTVLTILIGFLIGSVVNQWIGLGILSSVNDPSALASSRALELSSIGFIIPGLIATWMDREGTVETVSGLLTSAVITRLILILIVPAAVQRHAVEQPSLLALWSALSGR